MKNGQKSIRLNSIHSDSMRGINPNKSEPRFQSESIQAQINPNRIFKTNQSEKRFVSHLKKTPKINPT